MIAPGVSSGSSGISLPGDGEDSNTPMMVIAVFAVIGLAALAYYFLTKSKVPPPPAKPAASAVIPGLSSGTAGAALGVVSNPSFFSGLGNMVSGLAKAFGGGGTTNTNTGSSAGLPTGVVKDPNSTSGYYNTITQQEVNANGQPAGLDAQDTSIGGASTQGCYNDTTGLVCPGDNGYDPTAA